jgi:hypothetical protein
MLEADMLRAGDAGRAAEAEVKGDGEGLGRAGVLLCEDGCRCMAGSSDAEIGAVAAVGVACGVEAAELALAIEIGVGVCLLAVGTGWVYTVPSSPGAKVKAEQKPSEEVMSSVRPSLDQDRSVNVA